MNTFAFKKKLVLWNGVKGSPMRDQTRAAIMIQVLAQTESARMEIRGLI